MNDVSIIIVTWNNAPDIGRCLDSLSGIDQRMRAEILVVDNASSDQTVEVIQNGYPHVRVVCNKQNVGFAAANNQAMRMTDGRYVMLLNPDTSVDAGTVEVLVHYLDGSPKAWVAGPMILNPDRSLQVSGVRFPSRSNILVESLFLDRLFPHSRLFGSHKELFEDPHEPRAVDYVQGSALMVRREAINRVGVLDEGFFMYFEEADWCYRIKEAGGEVHYSPVGKVVHYGGNAFAHFDERRLVHYHRSMLRFFKKHYSLAQTLGLRPILALRSTIRVFLWGTISLVSASKRRVAISSARGYLRVLGLLLQRF
jgi:N-acetylglucosaminyl-diphospho-decaprenol L-rhamnosyltransferase